MLRSRTNLLLRAALLLTPILVSMSSVSAATLREQRASLRGASSSLRAAERFAKADRADDAKTAFQQAKQKLEQLAKELDPKLKRSFESAAKRLAKTHALLVKRGVELAELNPLTPTMASDGPKGRFDRGAISFTSQVAPILVAKCGRCHVDGSSGGFSLATYNSLMRGNRGGRVLVPGEGTSGVMMDLIESGDMPRGGLSITPQELSLLSRWITQGAKFDGDNADGNLKQIKPGSGAPAPPQPEPAMQTPEVVRPMGGETVSFALHIAPILVDRCGDCHVLNNRGNLRFTNFQQLLGSGSVTPGNPAGSTLIRRLRGDETPRMPLNAPPLSDEQIAKIATWVREGARFDGGLPTEGLERSTALVTARNATVDQLNEMRDKRTASNWRLALSDEAMESVTTEHFRVVGALPAEQLEALGAGAEKAIETATKLFGPVDARGRPTIYAFGRRINYSEFARMVERRGVDRGATGHVRFDPVDPYACVLIDPDSEQIDLQAVTQQAAALRVGDRAGGRAPDWFLQAAGRVTLARTFPQSGSVEQWKERLESNLAGMSGADDFMSGRMPPESAGVVGYHYVEAMMRNKRGFGRFMEEVAGGSSFDDAFAKQYKASPKELAEKWRESLKRRR